MNDNQIMTTEVKNECTGLEQMISLGPNDFVLSPESLEEQSPYQGEVSDGTTQIDGDGAGLRKMKTQYLVSQHSFTPDHEDKEDLQATGHPMAGSSSPYQIRQA